MIVIKNDNIILSNKINGQQYEFNGAMPNLSNNYTDDEIARSSTIYENVCSIDPKLSYGRKSVKPEEIKSLRNKRTSRLIEKLILSAAG